MFYSFYTERKLKRPNSYMALNIQQDYKCSTDNLKLKKKLYIN